MCVEINGVIFDGKELRYIEFRKTFYVYKFSKLCLNYESGIGVRKNIIKNFLLLNTTKWNNETSNKLLSFPAIFNLKLLHRSIFYSHKHTYIKYEIKIPLRKYEPIFAT